MTLRSAEKSVTIMTTSQGFLRKIEGFKPVFEQLKKRGVVIKIAAPMNKETEVAAKQMDGVAEIRHVATSARFVVVDGKEIMFMLMDDKEVHPTYDIGIWINSPFFASAIDTLFEIAWKGMKEVKVKK
jgi:hypothetical protein